MDKKRALKEELFSDSDSEGQTNGTTGNGVTGNGPVGSGVTVSKYLFWSISSRRRKNKNKSK